MKEEVDELEDHLFAVFHAGGKRHRHDVTDEMHREPRKEDELEEKFSPIVRGSSIGVHEVEDGLRSHQQTEDDRP